jgi:FAD/FMN-containing dehydrogenase
MDRRKFCKTTLAAGVAAGYPLLGGCGRREDTAAAPPPKADTSIAAVSLDRESIELEKAAINELAEAVNGTVMLSGHPQYDATRKIWNGMHDKHPALIVQAANTRDVVNAVEFARDNNVLLAIRGGGHSWPGKSVCEGGLMLDLSRMNEVTADRDAAVAVCGGGALLNNLDTACLDKGMVTTAGVVSHTGVGGFTLGGGFGRLNRKYGLTIDNLLAAEIVTADGQVRRASAEENPDLFWAIRGGGGNFGAVTKFEYRLHPFERNVLSGMLVWPIAEARDVLDFYGEWYQDLSRDLYVGPVMMTDPEGNSFVAMEVVYAGDPSVGEKELAPLRAVGKPVDDAVKFQDYMYLQTHEDATFAHGVRSYAKNGMVREITGELVDQLIESFRADPRLAFFTHTAGGAVKDVGETDTAFPHRNAETMMIVAGGWMDPADDEPAMAEARAWFAELEPYTGGYYDNIEYEGDEGVKRNYGPNYSRLREIKAEYDPGNLFRMNSNIEPA